MATKATKVQRRVMMAMYPAQPLNQYGFSYHIKGTTVPVARSTFHSLMIDGYITPADKSLRDFVLTEAGVEIAKKEIAKAFPEQSTLLKAPYRFCFNSTGLLRDEQDRFTGRENRERIPSMDGFAAGDELTVAYEGELSAADATEDGCEKLFALFNAPWARPDEYAGPSMSIGDVVTFFPGTEREISFAVARCGFEPVDARSSSIKERPARWIRNAAQLIEYRMAKAEDLLMSSGRSGRSR